MSIKPHNKTEACFLKLRKVLRKYKIEDREHPDIELFDLKNGIIIAREDDGADYFGKVYTIIKDLKPVKIEEARNILGQLTKVEVPKRLNCEYNALTKVDAACLSAEHIGESEYDMLPWRERVVTSQRGYSDIFHKYEGQPDKKQVEKSLDKFEDHFGLKLPYKRRAVKVPKVTITL